MTDAEKDMVFERLRQIADAVVVTFGSNCEVAIHDLTKPKSSLVYMAGNVTKRELGSPITDVIIRSLIKEGRNVKDKHSFKTILEDGRELKSTTTFIRDAKGEVFAAFCINVDTTDYINAIHCLENFAKFNDTGLSTQMTQSFASSVNDQVDALFEQAVGDVGKQPATMSTEEKIRLVSELEKKGAFQIKGVVNQVALRLGVSNFTIYNYLKKIRRG